ncbi:MAG: hypothetical protein K9L30_12035 [Desulfobacterales bacterium]|nr:hypothetical protein [Desulfobacterales bacterium]
MPKHSVTGIVMATVFEADPFIRGLSLEKTANKPFTVYENKDFVLVISGIGKINAATATTFSCMNYKPDVIFNLGAAGAADKLHPLGENYHINNVVELDRPSLKTGNASSVRPDIINGFNKATIATQDKAILKDEERIKISAAVNLVDMEAAAVVQVCKKFKTNCYLFKFVSDVPGHDMDNHIIENIKKYRRSFYLFFKDSVVPLIEAGLNQKK